MYMLQQSSAFTHKISPEYKYMTHISMAVISVTIEQMTTSERFVELQEFILSYINRVTKPTSMTYGV